MSRTYHHKESKEQRTPSKFKKMQKRKRKAKEKDALNKGNYDEIPIFKKTDKYDYD